MVGNWWARNYRTAAGRGMIMVTVGTAIALWYVFTLVFIGKGTLAPFDLPRRIMQALGDGRAISDRP